MELIVGFRSFWRIFSRVINPIYSQGKDAPSGPFSAVVVSEPLGSALGLRACLFYNHTYS